MVIESAHSLADSFYNNEVFRVFDLEYQLYRIGKDFSRGFTWTARQGEELTPRFDRMLLMFNHFPLEQRRLFVLQKRKSQRQEFPLKMERLKKKKKGSLKHKEIDLPSLSREIIALGIDKLIGLKEK